MLDPAEMGAGPDPRPKLIVTGSADDFRPPDQLAPLVAGWSNCELRVAEGASHFFPVGLDAVIAAADELLERLAPA